MHYMYLKFFISSSEISSLSLTGFCGKDKTNPTFCQLRFKIQTESILRWHFSREIVKYLYKRKRTKIDLLIILEKRSKLKLSCQQSCCRIWNWGDFELCISAPEMSTICLNVFAPLCSTYLNVFVPHIAALLCQRGISRVYSEEKISLQNEGGSHSAEKSKYGGGTKKWEGPCFVFFLHIFTKCSPRPFLATNEHWIQ